MIKTVLAVLWIITWHSTGAQSSALHLPDSTVHFDSALAVSGNCTPAFFNVRQ